MAHDDAAAQAAATYFDAWLAGDFARLRSVLADDVDFAGPLGQVRGGDDCLRGLQGLAPWLAVAVLAGSPFLAVVSGQPGAGGHHGPFGPIKGQYGGNWPY